jgi:4-alpha-glucanotransferase
VLIAVLAALGHDCGDEQARARSLDRLAARTHELPSMLVGEVGQPVPLGLGVTDAVLVHPDGTETRLAVEGGAITAVATPGYYRLILDREERTLAIAPAHCPLPSGTRHQRMWGAAIQIPSLNGPPPFAYGHFGQLDRAVAAFAARGADAVAINPVHAMFPGEGRNYSPYSPSSRRFLNVAMADPGLVGLPSLAGPESAALIDWEQAIPDHFAKLRHLYDQCDADWRAQRLRAFAQDEAVNRHALFCALHCHFRREGARRWQDWPTALHDPGAAAVRAFAAAYQAEIDFHLFAEWLTSEGLRTVQARARAGGMAIGLVADLAVGVDPGGSDAWSMPEAMLKGLTIGAPPDPLGPLGQNWALTSYSPDGLRKTGYAPWIAMLRAALTSAGGLRIDHAFGLARLWVIPDGGGPHQGAYLGYPMVDLVRLLALEAHLAGAIVIAEDLGTSPSGFSDEMAHRHMLGMRVLPFQRAADHGFIGAHDYDAMAVAMTGTHDTATIAGWWRGRDLDWADALGRLPEDCDRQQAEAIRDWDRGLLWSTIGDGSARPSPAEPDAVVAAALGHIGRSPACLAIAPLEDILALDEQPNLPGTTSEHPNWQRRMPVDLDVLLDEPATAARIDRLSGR